MTILQILPILAYALAFVTVLAVAAGDGRPRNGLWIYPAALGAAFGLFSAATLLREGVAQFWFNHTTTFAGNQVWFDLLAATAIGFVMLLPRARAVGMRRVPWAVATLLLACIVLLPMVARLLWLEERARRSVDHSART